MVTIQINNWARFNPRHKDVKHSSWFRLEHNFFENPDFFALNHEEISVFLYLICIASKKNGEPFSVNFDHMRVIGRCSEAAFWGCMEKLQQIQGAPVSVTRNPVHVTNAITTDGRTNGTDGREPPPFLDERVPHKTSTQSAELPSKKERDFPGGISLEIYKGWVELYGNEAWVKNEIRCAVDWMTRAKKPGSIKSPAQFFSKWLKKSFSEDNERTAKKQKPHTTQDHWPEVEAEDEFDGGLRS